MVGVPALAYSAAMTEQPIRLARYFEVFIEERSPSANMTARPR